MFFNWQLAEIKLSSDFHIKKLLSLGFVRYTDWLGTYSIFIFNHFSQKHNFFTAC